MASFEDKFRELERVFEKWSAKFDSQLLASSSHGSDSPGIRSKVGYNDRTLLVRIHLEEYSVSWDVLNQVFSKIGYVEYIEVFAPDSQFHSQVRFQDRESVVKAVERYDGRCIYDGCCLMELVLEVPTSDPLSKIEESESTSFSSELSEKYRDQGIQSEFCREKDASLGREFLYSSESGNQCSSLSEDSTDELHLNGVPSKIHAWQSLVVSNPRVKIYQSDCEFLDSRPEAGIRELKSINELLLNPSQEASCPSSSQQMEFIAADLEAGEEMKTEDSGSLNQATSSNLGANSESFESPDLQPVVVDEVATGFNQPLSRFGLHLDAQAKSISDLKQGNGITSTLDLDHWDEKKFSIWMQNCDEWDFVTLDDVLGIRNLDMQPRDVDDNVGTRQIESLMMQQHLLSAHELFEKMPEKKLIDVDETVALLNVVGDFYGSIDSCSSFVFDPGEVACYYLDSGANSFVFDPGGLDFQCL